MAQIQEVDAPMVNRALFTILRYWGDSLEREREREWWREVHKTEKSVKSDRISQKEVKAALLSK